MADDAHEFAVFVRTHSVPLQRAGYLLTGNWSSAEDLAQSALTKLWQRWDAVARPEARPAYARRILMTTFLDWKRQRWRAELPVEYVPDTAGGDDTDSTLDDPVVLTALRALPRHQRAIVVLCYFDDLTEQSVAEALGCTVGTVKSQKSRALRRLRADPTLQQLFTGGHD